VRGIIFCTNDFLPGVLAGLRRGITEQPGARIAIDLERQLVTAPSGTVHHFGIDPFRKQCLLRRRDRTDAGHRNAIAAFERRQAGEAGCGVPWASAAYHSLIIWVVNRGSRRIT